MGGVSLDGLSSLQDINAGFDEVYVLSLPSFVWFKANYTSSDPRIQHTCNIIGERQMLSIGGFDPRAASLSAAYNDTDPYWEGMKVFDLTELQWTNYFNANAAPYVAPSAVAAHYAAGSRYPSTWSSSDLENLFVEPKTNLFTPIEPTASASPQPGTPTTNRKAAVIGGAVGGAAGVALVILALYLLARKRANGKGRKQEENKLPPKYINGEPNLLENVSEVGEAFPHEADSRQAMPHEVDSGQNLPHEADSGLFYELSSHMRVGQNDVH